MSRSVCRLRPLVSTGKLFAVFLFGLRQFFPAFSQADLFV
jgi:hypothetical protein